MTESLVLSSILRIIIKLFLLEQMKLFDFGILKLSQKQQNLLVLLPKLKIHFLLILDDFYKNNST